MLAISIRGQLHTRSHLVLKLKKNWIYPFTALNDISAKSQNDLERGSLFVFS